MDSALLFLSGIPAVLEELSVEIFLLWIGSESLIINFRVLELDLPLPWGFESVNLIILGIVLHVKTGDHIPICHPVARGLGLR